MDPATIAKFLKQTRLLRPPTHRLSTFGATRIEYHLVSPVEDLPERTRLREGWVVSEKPAILTPEALRDRFEGFGEDAKEFSDWLTGRYRDLLRALEYRFKNQGLRTRVVHRSPASAAQAIREDVDTRSVDAAAVIECPDAAWSLALMKFTLDEASRSFPTNLRDLERRGLFDADSGEDRRRRVEVEALFDQARTDPSARAELGRRLKAYDLLGEYEDRFLSLFR